MKSKIHEHSNFLLKKVSKTQVWITPLLIMLSISSKAQNLVPNPSFEDTVSCPDGVNNVSDAVGWFSSKSSPDYFNPCANINAPYMGIPNNMAGHQAPIDGNTYAGLATYVLNPGNNIRELISTQLNHTLNIGVKYFVSAYISRADTNYWDCASNKFGFRFSTIPYYASVNSCPIDNFSHIHFDSIISDKENWSWMAGDFVADSAYQYLIIGNFYDDAHTDTSHCPSLLNYAAYYYIDKVCVSTDSLLCYVPTALNNNHLYEQSFYPNPANNIINIATNNFITNDIISYDVLGQVMSRTKTINGKASINCSTWREGLYFIKICQNCFKVIIKH